MAPTRKILFRIEGCPYCRNAEEALIKAGVKFERFEVDKKDRSIVQILSGQPTVPILVEVTGCENQDDDIIANIAKFKS